MKGSSDNPFALVWVCYSKILLEHLCICVCLFSSPWVFSLWVCYSLRPIILFVNIKSGTGSASKSISAFVQLASSLRWSSPCTAHSPVWKVQVHPCPHYFNAGYPRSNGPTHARGPADRGMPHALSRKHCSTRQHNLLQITIKRYNLASSVTIKWIAI
jgi:hypothetical protein